MPVLVTKRSKLTGAIHSMLLPTTEAKMMRWEHERASCPLVQEMFPELNDEEREYLLTGSTQAEWDDAFKEEE